MRCAIDSRNLEDAFRTKVGCRAVVSNREAVKWRDLGSNRQAEGGDLCGGVNQERSLTLILCFEGIVRGEREEVQMQTKSNRGEKGNLFARHGNRYICYGPARQQAWWMPRNFEEMTRGFWQGSR